MFVQVTAKMSGVFFYETQCIYLQWKTNKKSYMAYQMAATAGTLNDLEGHSPVAGIFKCNPSNICAAFTQI